MLLLEGEARCVAGSYTYKAHSHVYGGQAANGTPMVALRRGGGVVEYRGHETIVWLDMAGSAHGRLRLLSTLSFFALFSAAVALNSTLPSSPILAIKEWGNGSVNSSSFSGGLLSLPAHEPKSSGNPGGAPTFFDDDDKPRKPPYFPSLKGAAADALQEAWLQIVLYRQAASLHVFDWFAIDEYTVLASNDAESWFGKVKSAAYAIISHAFSRCALTATAAAAAAAAICSML